MFHKRTFSSFTAAVVFTSVSTFAFGQSFGIPTKEMPADVKAVDFGFYLAGSGETGPFLFLDADPTMEAAYVFRQGDEVVSFEGSAISSWTELNERTGTATENRPYTFGVKRDGDIVDLPITPSVYRLDREGDVGFGFRPAYSVDQGVYIVSLTPGWPAERELEAGDRFMRIEGREIHRINDLTFAMNAAREGNTYTFWIRRGDQDKRVELRPNSYPVRPVLRGFYEPFLPVAPPDADVRISTSIINRLAVTNHAVIFVVHILARHETYFHKILHLPSFGENEFSLTSHTIGKTAMLFAGKVEGADYAQVATLEFTMVPEEEGDFELSGGAFIIATPEPAEPKRTYLQILRPEPEVIHVRKGP